MKYFSDLHKHENLPLLNLDEEDSRSTQASTQASITVQEVEHFYRFAQYIHLPEYTIIDVLIQSEFQEQQSVEALWKACLNHRRTSPINEYRMRSTNPYKTRITPHHL